LIAVAVGTATDRVARREIPRADEYYVVSGDFHVHTFFGDGALAPWEIRREAARRGLDVIAITNHNHRVAARIGARLSGPGPLLIPGQEITAPLFHVIGVGLTETVDWRLTASDAVRAVHDQGGIAIAAHPVPASWRAEADADAVLDGAEAASLTPNTRSADQLQAFYRRVRARNADVAPIGSSDFHFHQPLGRCRTYAFASEPTRPAILDAIRAGRTVAVDPAGGLTGDAPLVAHVQRIRALEPPTKPGLVASAAALLAFVSLFALFAFR
jgi:predicted metal-dependent phosphoesterase TrpH